MSRILNFVAWLSLVFCAPLVAVAQPFQLGATENHVIQPIPPDLQQGQIFDESLINKYRPAMDWVEIPPAFAGTWQSNQAVTTSMQLFQNGQWLPVDVGQGIVRKNAETLVRGYQQDARGNIWHCTGVEQDSRVQGDKILTIYMKRGVQMSVLAPNRISRHVSSVALEISQTDSRIRKSYYEEENMIQTVSPDGRQFVSQTEVTRGVDPRQPQAHGILQEVCYRTGPFQPVDNLSGIDLRQAFRLFLHMHGWDALIPGNPKVGNTYQSPAQ